MRVQRLIPFAMSAICALGVAVSSAKADGMPRKASTVSAPFSWSGFYVGVDAGGGWGEHDRDTGTFQNSYRSRGGLVGGHIGYDVQMSHIVLGFVGTGAWANIEGDDAGVGGTTDKTRLESLWTARARLGFTVNGTTLIYGTAGWSWAGAEHINIAGVPATASRTIDGFVIGGGWEYAFDRRWSVKLEYLHHDLGTYSAAPAGLNPFRVDNSLETIMLGLSYRF